MQPISHDTLHFRIFCEVLVSNFRLKSLLRNRILGKTYISFILLVYINHIWSENNISKPKTKQKQRLVRILVKLLQK